MAHRETDGPEPYSLIFSLVVGDISLTFVSFESADRWSGPW